jgi:hypothetical protein
MRLRALIIASTISLLGGVALAAPAQAQRQDVHDRAADVLRFTSSATAPDEKHVDPSVRNGDVLLTRVSHSRSQVVVAQRFRGLTRPTIATSYTFSIRGSNHLTRLVSFTATHARPAGTGVQVLRNSNLTRVRCQAAGRINYRAHQVTVRVSRTCVGKAARVRVTADTTSMAGAGNTSISFSDSAFSPPLGGHVRWTRWLKRG